MKALVKQFHSTNYIIGLYVRLQVKLVVDENPFDLKKRYYVHVHSSPKRIVYIILIFYSNHISTDEKESSQITLLHIFEKMTFNRSICENQPHKDMTLPVLM